MMKKAVKALAVFLAVFFCLSALTTAVFAITAAESPKGGTFLFGSYPQSRVSDRGLIARLDTKAALTKSDRIVLDGIVYQSQRVEGKSVPGDAPFSVVHGYIPNVTYWFRVEPIAWRVLDKDDEGVLLMAEYVLCTHVYNEQVREDNTWENSDVRKWLNADFAQEAFTSEERSFLLYSSLTNEDNPIHGTYNGEPLSYVGETYNGYPYQGTEGGNDTTDRIFLPSFNEITNKDYGFNLEWTALDDFGRFAGYYDTDPERQAVGTDYAKCQGVWANQKYEGGLPVATCRYWLRTPGFENGYAAAVLEDGRVTTGWPVNYNIVGIRPMMRVSADAVASEIPTPDDPDNPDNPIVNRPFEVDGPEGTVHYKQKDLKFTADTEVTWSSSNPRIVEIDEDGNLTIHRVGTVTITATSKQTGETVEVQMEVSYLWWQQLIRIFLFGWLWY